MHGNSSSTGLALPARLARSLLEIAEGERVPSIRRLAAATHMSVGSVSQALRQLQESGAIALEKRGRLGTVLTGRSLGGLWAAAEGGPLVYAMSLPMHRRFEGLATGLKMAFSRHEIEAYPIFVRDSRTRLEALMGHRCDVVLMSALAAEALCGPEQEVVWTLPPGSWVSRYEVYYRAEAPEDGPPWRVAVDPDSFDHTRLVELEFAGRPIELLQASYMRFPHLLRSGAVDAIVWTADQDEIYLGPGIGHRRLSERVDALVGVQAASTAFVIRAGHDALRAVLRAALDAEDLIEIQRQVLAGDMLPKY